ncbi:unnamed protein product [Bursaphelenchus xylophilus]|uniref:(pine wood nematode) hypothetical protein n=1 Tax=Bursaphelenchus xylophilus TaxID=6326 RepID=A0A1I7S3W3_BURXY|nr:unnamed protein product [Bursaphelenchus xylophilus]CAG9116534.1 unnamed protein product [Bursaphelenchus xylophilus]
MAEIMKQRLNQKLMLLENAVARISSMKAELRTNAEKVRRDIAGAVKHQISCLRAREQELLGQLDQVVGVREESFSDQQDVLSKAIGACQNSLETMKATGEENLASVEKALIRLNALSLKPKGNPSIAFEFDSTESRLVTSTFGKLFTDVHNQLESLPMDMEMYEDDFLSHKSVMKLPMDKESSQSTASEDSNCSFEVIDPALIDKSLPIVGAYIDQVVNSSNNKWLREDCQTPTAPQLFSKRDSYHSLPMDAFRPPSVTSHTDEFKFGNVIREIQDSENKKWLLQTPASTSVEDISQKLSSRLCLSSPTVSVIKKSDSEWLLKPKLTPSLEHVPYSNSTGHQVPPGYNHVPFLREIMESKENQSQSIDRNKWLAK